MEERISNNEPPGATTTLNLVLEGERYKLRDSLNLKWPFLLGLPQVYKFIQSNIKYKDLSITENV